MRYYLQSTLSSKYKSIINEAEFVIWKCKPLSEFMGNGDEFSSTGNSGSDTPEENIFNSNSNRNSISNVTVISSISPNSSNFHNSLVSPNPKIKLDIGVEDWLHVSFEIDKTRFHLRDVITGEVVFKKVSLKLSMMEVQVIRVESLLGHGVNASSEKEVIGKFEIMDGVPEQCKLALLYIILYYLIHYIILSNTLYYII